MPTWEHKHGVSGDGGLPPGSKGLTVPFAYHDRGIMATIGPDIAVQIEQGQIDRTPPGIGAGTAWPAARDLWPGCSLDQIRSGRDST